MSREILDDLVEELGYSEKDEFPKYLEQILYYGFLEDTALATLLETELDDLDELLSSSEHLTLKEWKSYRSKIVRYLKKERKKYETLYYRSKT